MNNCFAVIIKEKGCQNCASMCIEKALTSIALNEVVALSFGYQLSIASTVGNNIHILVTNPSFDFAATFVVQNTSDILLDLPLDNGCYRVYIAITAIPCTNALVCPTAL